MFRFIKYVVLSIFLLGGIGYSATGDPLIEGKAGSGASLTGLNASNVSSGTLSNSRFSALSDLGGGSGSTYLKKDGSWDAPESSGELDWFCADSYGTHGTQAAITAAISAAQSNGGGVVYISAGTWTITSTIVISGGSTLGLYGQIHLRGAGPRATILRRTTNWTSGDTIRLKKGTTGYLYSCSVQDLQIMYQNVPTDMTTSDAHISCYYGIDCFFRNLVLTNGGVGIEMYGRCYGNTIDFVNISIDADHTGNIGMAFYLGAVDGGGGNYDCTCIITNCDLYPSGMLWNYGIYIASSDGLWFSNVHVGRGLQAAVYIDPHNSSNNVSGLKFNNCWFDSDISSQPYAVRMADSTSGNYGLINFTACMFQGIYCNYGLVIDSGCTVRSVVVDGCIFFNYQRNAIAISGGNHISITNNQIRGSNASGGSYDAIYISTNYFTISGNHIGYLWNSTGDSLERYGINVGGSSDYFDVTNNNLRGNASNTGLYVSSGGTHKTTVVNPDDTSNDS